MRQQAMVVCIDIDQMSNRSIYIDHSRFRGMILADPPGFGNPLSALAAIAVSAGESGSINGPLSCCRQWMAEIEHFFGQVCANSQIADSNAADM